jgi:hypothetical protein
MIPREILKKIRQIEIRTNRVVTEADVCLDGKYQLLFSPALTSVLSPRRGFQPVTIFDCPASRSTNPVAGCFKETENVSPSPWGEGRDEGGRNTNFTSA